jgi:hypothetical protein
MRMLVIFDPRRARVQIDDNGGGEIFDTRRTGVQTDDNGGGAPGQPSTSIYGQPGPKSKRWSNPCLDF